jgi:DNA-binding PadR family transcriptional regulator
MREDSFKEHWTCWSSRHSWPGHATGTPSPLHRLEKRQLLAAEWGISDTNRKVKVYQLTDAGQRQLEKRSRIWNEYADAVSRVLESG